METAAVSRSEEEPLGSYRALLEERLRRSGLRITQQRLAILEFLSGTTSHPTADEVGRAVNLDATLASRASVYNVLRSLRDAGLVEELVLDDALARFDANVNRHHHFICRACKRVEDVDWAELPLRRRTKLPDGKSVEDLSVVLRGLCTACQKS